MIEEFPSLPPTRLALSMTPEPGESLNSLVLNLSWRFRETPADLLARLDLADPAARDQSDAESVLDLAGDAVHFLATRLGLSPATVRSMTLLDEAPRLRQAATATGRKGGISSQFWASPNYSNYCAACLRHGSDANPDRAVWKTRWRSPWTFACLEHEAFLSHRCPACNFDVGDSNRTFGRGLVTNPAHGPAHPATCRAVPLKAVSRGSRPSLCGHRLDGSEAVRPAPSAVLGLQRTVDRLLIDDSDVALYGEPLPPWQRLRDLRTVAVAIQYADGYEALEGLPDEVSEPTAAYLNRRRIAVTEHGVGRWACPGFPSALSRAPLDPVIRAGLLIAADRLLSTRQPPRLLADLAARAGDTEKTQWVGSRVRMRASKTLVEAFSQRTPSLLAPTPLLIKTANGSGLALKNVPAFLPRGLIEQHFPEHVGRPRRVQQAVPFLLAQALGGISLRQARAYLGYGSSNGNINNTDRRRSVVPDLVERAATVLGVIDALPHVDYQARRDYFDSTWRIPDDLWEPLRALAEKDKWHIKGSPDLLRRQYSVYVWAKVTQGDSTVSPMYDGRGNGDSGFMRDLRMRPHRVVELDSVAAKILAMIDGPARS